MFKCITIFAHKMKDISQLTKNIPIDVMDINISVKYSLKTCPKLLPINPTFTTFFIEELSIC